MLKKFDLVIIGAHNGSTTEELIPKQKKQCFANRTCSLQFTIIKT